jgi:hypothetical protein
VPHARVKSRIYLRSQEVTLSGIECPLETPWIDYLELVKDFLKYSKALKHLVMSSGKMENSINTSS